MAIELIRKKYCSTCKLITGHYVRTKYVPGRYGACIEIVTLVCKICLGKNSSAETPLKLVGRNRKE